eukprot:scaffold109621_cov35-Prasinocladus_malaysianus.AAC.1
MAWRLLRIARHVTYLNVGDRYDVLLEHAVSKGPADRQHPADAPCPGPDHHAPGLLDALPLLKPVGLVVDAHGVCFALFAQDGARVADIGHQQTPPVLTKWPKTRFLGNLNLDWKHLSKQKQKEAKSENQSLAIHWPHSIN